jgi:hypothetical protein
MHKKLINEGLLNGIEVVNEHTYSDEALQIALDNDLTMIGTSDIHGLIDWDYKVHKGGHRPVTLVFAKDKTSEGIKEGLVNRRTVVNTNNLLVGRTEYLIPLLEASITVQKAEYQGDSQVLYVTLKNHTNIEFTLKNKSEFTLHTRSDLVKIEPLEEIVVQVKTIKRLPKTELSFEVLNAVYEPNLHPDLKISVVIE